MARDDLPPRQLFAGPTVVVSGPTAVALSRFLRKHRREWEEHVAPYARLTMDIATTVEAFDRCAETFKRSQVPDSEVTQLPIAEPFLRLEAMETTREAADRLRVSERWVRRMLIDGRLVGRKVGGRWMVDSEGLEK